MTPYERILRNKGMEQFSIEQEKPVAPVAPFPRNNTGLTVLVLAVTPLVYKAVLDPSAQSLLGYGLSTVGIGAGLWCLATGLKAQALYDAAKVARAPKLPYRLIGAGLMGASSGGLALFQGGAPLQAVLVMLIMAALCLVAFGRDPSRDKGLDTVQQRQSHKLDDISARVGKQMERVREAAAIHCDRDVMPRMRAFDQAVEKLLRVAMQDPERVGSLRKYFSVFLDGAAEASERYASVYTGTGDPAIKQKYLGLLDRLTHAFDSKAHEYAAAGQMKFDVQHDVLDTKLAQEARSSSDHAAQPAAG